MFLICFRMPLGPFGWFFLLMLVAIASCMFVSTVAVGRRKKYKAQFGGHTALELHDVVSGDVQWKIVYKKSSGGRFLKSLAGNSLETTRFC